MHAWVILCVQRSLLLTQSSAKIKKDSQSQPQQSRPRPLRNRHWGGGVGGYIHPTPPSFLALARHLMGPRRRRGGGGLPCTPLIQRIPFNVMKEQERERIELG